MDCLQFTRIRTASTLIGESVFARCFLHSNQNAFPPPGFFRGPVVKPFSGDPKVFIEDVRRRFTAQRLSLMLRDICCLELLHKSNTGN